MRLTGIFIGTLSTLVMTGTIILGGAQASPPATAGPAAPAAPSATVQLVGEAPPPDAPLSLWYRAPAADSPLIPRPSGRGANAEWVRALPVGNGRLGAIVFGGVVNERLQLNEDTLWAGRPYDPVSPEAKDALPEVRRLLAAG